MNPQRFARKSKNVSGERYSGGKGRNTQRKPKTKAQIARGKKEAAAKLARTKASQQRSIQKDANKMEKEYEIFPNILQIPKYLLFKDNY